MQSFRLVYYMEYDPICHLYFLVKHSYLKTCSYPEKIQRTCEILHGKALESIASELLQCSELVYVSMCGRMQINVKFRLK